MPRPRTFIESDVLDRSIAAFMYSGYHGTSTRDLVRATGLGQQSLYNSFGDKRTLFITTLEHYIESRINPLLERVQASDADIRSIVGFFSGYIDEVESGNACSGCLLVNTISEFGASDPELDLIISAHLARMVDAFTHAISRAERIGALSTNLDARAVAHDLTSLLFGLAVSARTGASRDHLVGIITIALQPLY